MKDLLILLLMNFVDLFVQKFYVTTITTYDDGNLLEDVMLAVTNISPKDRPFMESIGRKKAIQILHQWPGDTLAARASPATLENATITGGTVAAPSRITNLTEYMTKAWNVSNSEIASKGAGVDDQFVYQRNKKMQELINGIEYDLIRSTLVTGSTAVTRKMKGLLAAITTNTSAVATTTTLTEAAFNGLFELCWIAGGNPRAVFVNSALKKAITAFAGVSITKQIAAEKKTMVDAVDFYVNDFTGTAEIILTRDMPSGAGTNGIAVVDLQYYSTAYLIPIRDAEVGQVTFGKLGALEAECTLEYRAEASSAYYYNYAS
jgi:hypothetical protein